MIYISVKLLSFMILVVMRDWWNQLRKLGEYKEN
jgi:hypothetical protein